MNRKFLLSFLALFVCALFLAGCNKGSSQTANTNSEEAKKQAEVEVKAPHLAKTVKGDIERMGLAVQMAMDALKDNKWPEVVTQVNAIDKEVMAALADTPEKNKGAAIREALQEMKPVVEKTIKSAENRSKETESQLRDLQTRVNGLKVYVNL